MTMTAERLLTCADGRCAGREYATAATEGETVWVPFIADSCPFTLAPFWDFAVYTVCARDDGLFLEAAS
jgi:hypothetical protein